jgi:aminoglycoside phosphotransferase family enzyme/predicted kinase
VIEVAVRMRRFDQAGLLPEALATGALTGDQLEAFAERLAHFHDAAAVAPPGGPYGTPEAVIAPALANLEVVERLHPELGASTLVSWTQLEADRLQPLFADRLARGRVREGHGDLHLGNLVLHQGGVVGFDCLEFNPALRWIDALSDVAFLAMDLESRGHADLAATFTSSWIEAANDHHAALVLPVYLIYRAIVRATVAAIRSTQSNVGPHADPAVAADATAESDRYLAVAERLLVDRRPILVATSGVSGSGKTTVAGRVAAALGAVRLRSDVERKRIFGMAAIDRPRDAEEEAALYSPEASRRTYARLAERARLILAAGTSVVVDAACNRRWERRTLADAAREAGVLMVWLSLEVSEAVAVARVAARQAVGTDASDASVDVVRAQLAAREPIQSEEFARTSDGDLLESLIMITGADLENPEFVQRLEAGLLARSGS